jgi:hypothetical protein
MKRVSNVLGVVCGKAAGVLRLRIVACSQCRTLTASCMRTCSSCRRDTAERHGADKTLHLLTGCPQPTVPVLSFPMTAPRPLPAQPSGRCTRCAESWQPSTIPKLLLKHLSGLSMPFSRRRPWRCSARSWVRCRGCCAWADTPDAPSSSTLPPQSSPRWGLVVQQQSLLDLKQQRVQGWPIEPAVQAANLKPWCPTEECWL